MNPEWGEDRLAEKVLIVDDSVSMRQMERMILTQAGYEVVEASDGKDALSKLSADISVVVTDLNMPNMNGVELVEAIRAGDVNRSVQILILTTESESEKKRQGKEAGATAWLTKPFEQHQLLKAVRKISEKVRF